MIGSGYRTQSEPVRFNYGVCQKCWEERRSLLWLDFGLGSFKTEAVSVTSEESLSENDVSGEEVRATR